MSNDAEDDGEVHQRAFNHLSDLITEVEILADREPENEEDLRDLIDRAERLLDHVDNVEYELVQAVREGYDS
jgi:ABC-type transporter Mla subunit MlaD